MPRILKSVLAAAKAALAPRSQPGLTRSNDEVSGIRLAAKPTKPAEPPPPDYENCKHVFADFPLPAEGKGRVYQCQLCRAIGFRRQRFGGPGKIELYTCSRDKCLDIAVRRMTGRGPRGAYIWSCIKHGAQIVEQPKPAP